MPDFSDDGATPLHKADFRRAVLARRRAMSAAERAAAAARVQAELIDVVRRTAPRCVAGYIPVGSEPGGPDLPEALVAALRPGARLLLPVLRPDLDLDWAAYEGPDALRAAGRGLREPSGPRLGVDAVTAADLVVVPAVAVDREGVRLGRGGGSYDRVLARVAGGVLTVALLHDGELVDVVPAEPHDRRVRAVVAPESGLRHLPEG